jgi:hypothetical protein
MPLTPQNRQEQWYQKMSDLSAPSLTAQNRQEEWYQQIVNASGAQPEPFIVELTPTAADYSGTMDKTPSEITSAIVDNKSIIFDIPSLSARVVADQFIEYNDIIQAGAKVFFDINSSPVLITILSNYSESKYATNIYSLTPFQSEE